MINLYLPKIHKKNINGRNELLFTGELFSFAVSNYDIDIIQEIILKKKYPEAIRDLVRDAVCYLLMNHGFNPSKLLKSNLFGDTLGKTHLTAGSNPLEILRSGRGQRLYNKFQLPIFAFVLLGDLFHRSDPISGEDEKLILKLVNSQVSFMKEQQNSLRDGRTQLFYRFPLRMP